MQPDILTAAELDERLTDMGRVTRAKWGFRANKERVRVHDAALRRELENTRQALRDLLADYDENAGPAISGAAENARALLGEVS